MSLPYGKNLWRRFEMKQCITREILNNTRYNSFDYLIRFPECKVPQTALNVKLKSPSRETSSHSVYFVLKVVLHQ